MSATIKIGGGEFPLAAVPEMANSATTVKVTASDTVTPQAVYAAVSGAGSYVISTDGVDATEVDNVLFVGSVGYDGGNITFSMRQKTADEISKEQMQAQTDVLGQQITTLTLSGADKDALIAQLGAQMVQAQLDIAALKGGAA